MPVKRRKNSDPVDKVANDFEKFHWGNEAKKIRDVMVSEPQALFEIGSLVSLCYRTEKGSRKTNEWEHEFETPPKLCADEKGKLYIIGGKYKVTEAGIEG